MLLRVVIIFIIIIILKSLKVASLLLPILSGYFEALFAITVFHQEVVRLLLAFPGCRIQSCLT